LQRGGETRRPVLLCVQLAAIAALSSTLGGCAALPAIEAGAAVISGLSQLSGLSEKLENFFSGSSEQKTTQNSLPPKIVTEADFLRGGDSVSARGDFVTAAWFYTKAADANPNSLQARMRLANAQMALKDDASAFANYQAALMLSPNDAEAAMQLGELELARGDGKSALDHFTVAIQARRSDPKLYNLMGVAFTMQNKYELARQSFEIGLNLKPDYTTLQNNYGMMQLQSGQYDAALATFTRLVQSPEANDRYRTNRALVKVAMGDIEAALVDAPGMDEAGLRLLLTRYQPKGEPIQMAAAENIQIDIGPRPHARETIPAALQDALVAPTLVLEKLPAKVAKSHYGDLPTQPQ
jgi:Flp pilus assembly protein TadD